MRRGREETKLEGQEEQEHGTRKQQQETAGCFGALFWKNENKNENESGEDNESAHSNDRDHGTRTEAQRKLRHLCSTMKK